MGCGWIDSQVETPETFEVPGWRVLWVGVGEDATPDEMERPEKRAPSCLGDLLGIINYTGLWEL